jgi:hypothetical protein
MIISEESSAMPGSLIFGTGFVQNIGFHASPENAIVATKLA